MKEFKGTPGPWHIGGSQFGDENEHADFIIRTDDGECVIGGCGCCGSPYLGGVSDEAQSADAHLIATSPRLLSALQNLVEIYDDKSGKQWTTSTKRLALDEAHAAIKQALGETK